MGLDRLLAEEQLGGDLRVGQPVAGEVVESASRRPRHLLPRPAGDLGRLLPPGAGGNLLRSTGFFDGSAAGGHVIVLAAWLLAGLALLLAAARARRPVTS